jgi:hypothetical protein
VSYPGLGSRLAAPVEVERDYSRHPIPGQLALWLPADARGDRAPLFPFTAFLAAQCPTATPHCNPSSPF